MLPMLHNSRLTKTLLFLLGCLAATVAQAGMIKGTAMDSASGLYLQGVRISVEGTNRKVSSERGGDFEIRGLNAGTYEISASYIGYPTVKQTIVIEGVEAIAFTTIDFNAESLAELEAYTVEGSLLGEAKAINIQRSASNLKSVISSDALGQFVDRNAAEALSRLSGVAVEQDQGEGKFITIRGADPSLNQIAIDGVVAATPEADGRSTALNIISIDQLESIEVTKSWLPDQSANFIGGSVNLKTRSALDRGARFASVEFAYGQHEIADDRSYRTNFTYSDVLLKKKNLGIQFSLDFSEDNRGSETLTAFYDPVLELDLTSGTAPEFGWEVERLGFENFTITRKRTGISGKLEYEISDNHKFNFSASSNKFDDDVTLEQTGFQGDDREAGFAGRNRLTEDVAIELGLDPNDPEVASRISSSREQDFILSFDELLQLGDFAFDPLSQNVTFQRWTVMPGKRWQSTITNDEILTLQGGGEHRLWDRFDLDYTIYKSTADKHQDLDVINFWAPRFDAEYGIGPNGLPFFSEIEESEVYTDPSSYRIVQDPPRGSLRLETRDFTDERKGYEVNLETEYDYGDFRWTSKFGLASDKRTKTVDFVPDNFERIRLIETDEIFPLILSEPFLNGGKLGAFLESTGDFEFGPVVSTPGARAFLNDPSTEGLVFSKNSGRDDVADITGPLRDNYVSSEDIFAAYFMQTLDWRGFQFIAGFRYEKTTNSITNRLIDPRSENLPEQVQFAAPAIWPPLIELLGPDAFTSVVTNSRSYEHLLPAFHIIRRLGERTVVRASYTETIARPKFTDLLPFEIVPTGDGRFQTDIQLGNYDLEPTGSKNYDFSFERYFKSFGQFSVGFFHKELDGPIYEEGRLVRQETSPATELNEKYEPQGRDVQNWNTRQVTNAGQGKIKGMELSLQRKLDFLPGPLNGLGFGFNTTLSDSEVQLLVDSRDSEIIKLFKHSSWLSNLSVYYEKRAFMIRVSMLWRSGYLDEVETNTKELTKLHEGGVSLDAPLGVKGNGFDTFFDDFFKMDLRAEYRFKNHWSIFFEGTNLTSEPVIQYQGDSSRISSLVSTEPVYFIGLKWNM